MSSCEDIDIEEFQEAPYDNEFVYCCNDEYKLPISEISHIYDSCCMHGHLDESACEIIKSRISTSSSHQELLNSTIFRDLLKTLNRLLIFLYVSRSLYVHYYDHWET
jgi:hypothetical protein